MNRQIKNDAKIAGEITEKREKNIKHFLKDNMTYETAIYTTAVHYLEGKAWKDINNTLSEKIDKENNSVLENIQNSFKDLEYILCGEEVKENIVIKQNTNKTQFVLNYNAKNLVPKAQEYGTIIFYDNNIKNGILKIEKSIMYDSKGEEGTDIF